MKGGGKLALRTKDSQLPGHGFEDFRFETVEPLL